MNEYLHHEMVTSQGKACGIVNCYSGLLSFAPSIKSARRVTKASIAFASNAVSTTVFNEKGSYYFFRYSNLVDLNNQFEISREVQ